MVNVNTMKTYRTLPIISTPSLEEIIEQLSKRLPFLSEEGKNTLAEEIKKLVEELKDAPANGVYARAFRPQEVRILISEWDNEYIMYDRMRYPADYSPISMSTAIEVDGIKFHPVLVNNTKELYIHFVK